MKLQKKGTRQICIRIPIDVFMSAKRKIERLDKLGYKMNISMATALGLELWTAEPEFIDQRPKRRLTK